jgi:hypothetical protein
MPHGLSFGQPGFRGGGRSPSPATEAKPDGDDTITPEQPVRFPAVYQRGLRSNPGSRSHRPRGRSGAAAPDAAPATSYPLAAGL